MRLITDDALAIVTVFQEAEGEPYQGKLAVAHVIRNRMEEKFFSDGTVPSTVLRDRQFSGWNGNSPSRVRSVCIDDSSQAVKDCIGAWADSAEGDDPTAGAVSYYNPALVTPPWAADFVQTVVIGHHRFMRRP
jgi:N-acetylmuramoyl-L-alanine amidase